MLCLESVSREHVKVKCPHEPSSGMMWWWSRKIEPEHHDSHNIHTVALHWQLKTVKKSLPRHINTMASIEALYIFDEHKYVSSLAIDLHALAHLSNCPAATSS
jgi:hypothetical protein